MCFAMTVTAFALLFESSKAEVRPLTPALPAIRSDCVGQDMAEKPSEPYSSHPTTTMMFAMATQRRLLLFRAVNQ